MGYVLSVDVNKPYIDRATGISTTYDKSKSDITGVYNTSKAAREGLYGQQKATTSAAYQALLSGETAAQTARYQASQEPYKYNKSQAQGMYQGVRNDLYTQNVQGDRSLRERLANMGASGSGGLSMRKTQESAIGLQKGLTSADLEQQKFVDEQDRGLAQVGAENTAKLSELTAKSEYEKTQAMADIEAKLLQSGIDADSELGKQMAQLELAKSGELSANELERLRAEQDQRNTDIQMYLSMYLSGRISKKQFKAMTGMEI